MPAALPLVAVAIALSLRKGAGWSAGPRILLRALAGGLALLALASPKVFRQDRQAPWLILQDVSGSTRTQRAIPELPPDTPVRILYFARGLGPTPSAAGNPSRTLPGPALQWASSLGDDVAGVIFHSDGHFDSEDWRPAARQLARTSKPVWIVPMASAPADARLAGLELTRTAPDKVEAALTVASNFTGSGRLSLLADGREVLDRRVQLLANAPTTLRIQLSAGPEASLEVLARIDADDAFAENDRRLALLGPDQRRILLLGVSDLPPWAQRISVPVASARSMPEGARLEDFAAVVLADGQGVALWADQRKELARYVRGGGGLFLIGAGPHRTPAQRDDPLNQVLPLAVSPWSRKALHVVVALDSSGSMAQEVRTARGARPKFRLALDAVLSLQEHLTDQDALTVLTFSDKARLVYQAPPGQVDYSELAQRLSRIEPDGATDVRPALEMIRGMEASGPERLALVVSDLQTEPFDVADQARGLGRGQGARLAIAAVGEAGESPGSAALASLARQAEGWFVRIDDLQGLEKVFVDFLWQMRGAARREGTWQIRWTRAPWNLQGLSLPAARVILAAAGKKNAEILARADAHDVLGRWSVQLGRSAMLALDPQEPENRPVLDSAGLARLVGAAVDWVMSSPGASRMQGRLERVGRRIHVQVTQDEFQDDRMEPLFGRVAPLGEGENVRIFPLLPSAPGLWQGSCEVGSDPQALAVEVRDDAGNTLWQQLSPAGQQVEYDRIGPDFQTLEELAALTGGKVVRPWQLAGQLQTFPAGRALSLWPWLAGLALVFMLLDWPLDALRARRG